MKKIALLAAVAVSLPVHAEDLASGFRTCSEFSSPTEFVTRTAANRSPLVIDISYFQPRKGLRFDGLPVIAVFGWEQNGGQLFPRGPGTAPPKMYGVTVEGTAAWAASLTSGTAAKSEVSQLTLINGMPSDSWVSKQKRAGHAYVDISCNLGW